MRKAIRFELQIWVEGDDEPAHDFAARVRAEVLRRLELTTDLHYSPSLAVAVERFEEIEG